MWGEMFWAAVESAAFVISDPHTLIRIGLAMIPPSCDIARVIREAVWLHANKVRWAEARDRIVFSWGHNQALQRAAESRLHDSRVALRRGLRRQALQGR